MLPNDTISDEELVIDDEKLTPEESALAIKKAEEERKAVLNKLADSITDLFQDRAKQRTSKESEWVKAQHLYNAPLLAGDPSVSDRPFGGPDHSAENRPTPNIVRTKCDTAVANCISLQFAAGEKNWDLFPPANTADPEVTAACRLMEREIEAQLADSKYGMHSRRAMEERVQLGTGVLKGPVNTGKLQIEYTKDASGEWVPTVSQNKAPKVMQVPVWRYYPDLSVADFAESMADIEVHPMTAIELSQYVNHPGFDGDAITEILRGHEGNDAIAPDAYNETLQRITAEMWSRNPYLYKNRYVVLEYHGPITYDEVEKLGLTPTYQSPTLEYYGEVWVCAGKVIRMELENIEGHYETPYSCSIWKRDPSSPFGFGHPLLLADPQRVITQAYHMILDNASLTSAPQVAMYHKYIQPTDGDWTMAPGKVWMMTDPSVSVDNAIKFFNAPNVIGQIMPVLELARMFAEEESATADFGGKQSPQNTDSATGQLILQHASTVLLDFLAEEWDDQVTEKIIRRWYAWNMQYNPKEEIKGNYSVDVRSSSEYKNKQMYIRDLERLQMETAQNPAMAMVVNADELVKARLSLMHLPSGRIVRNDQEIQAAQEAAQNKPDPEMIQLQIKKMDADTARGTLELKKMQLQFELQQQQQRELWEHEEKMGSNQARMAEAQAQVLKARSEVEVEMIKLAQNDAQFRAKLDSDKEIQSLKTSSAVFLKGMEQATKEEENSLYNKELEIKKETGSGI